MYPAMITPWEDPAASKANDKTFVKVIARAIHVLFWTASERKVQKSVPTRPTAYAPVGMLNLTENHVQ